jgi:tetratricopeptide (TPR) repeat protein
MKHGVSLLLGCVLFALLGPTQVTAAPTNQLARGVSEFYTAFDDWSYDGFVAAAKLCAAAAQANPTSFPAFYWKGVAEFHAVLWCERQEPGEARTRVAQLPRRIEGAGKAFEAGLRLKPDDPECHALLSALLGLQIARHPTTAIWRGPQVMRHQRLALLNGPDNPRVQYLIGSGYYHAPGLLGDRKQALVYFLKAETLFAKEAAAGGEDPLQPRWGRSSCLTFTGKLYQEAGERDKALACYRRALEANPRDKLALQYLAGRTE